MASKWWFVGLVLALAGCAALPGDRAPAATLEVSLTNFGPAPELANEVWLNVDGPLRLADLRGRVVLIDMWTFG